MSDQRDDSVYLNDILDSIQAILDFTRDISFSDFAKDRKTMSATIREFEIIGEAVGNLNSKLKDKYKYTNWQDIKDFRNLLIHQYFGVDEEIVWDAIQTELPLLKKSVTSILKELQ